MPAHHPISHDVIIAGAGPVGLFLACELRLAGVSVLLLEAAADPQSPLKQLPFGLRGLTIPTQEAFYRRGLLDAIAAGQVVKGERAPPGAHWMEQARKPGGHFAGIAFFLDKVDASRWPYRLPGPVTAMIAVEMARIETVLTARAHELGAGIRRGLSVEGFEQTDEGVSVRAGGEVFHGAWLVGCDGGRSAVRKAGGFGFVGGDPEFTGYSLQIELSDPDRLASGRHYTPAGMYTYQKPGIVALVDFDGGAFHRTQPVTRTHVQAVLRKVTGVDVTVTALERAATWTDRARQAATYRKGRVLLAGDAAHTHSPLGGQGLNLGLGDAMNLGWKLAAAHRGRAPEGLLDSYGLERRPVGARVLDWSRAQVALMRPDRGGRALEAIMRDLIDTEDGATYFAERVWNASLRYDLGGGHPLTGRGAPDFTLTDGAKPSLLMQGGAGLLLDFDSDASLEALAASWSGRIVYRAGEAEDHLGLGALLVRPDGVVAWARDAGAAPDRDGAVQAASRWFGQPAA